MFHKRAKKQFAPGTFIATPARVAAIIHLCFALILLLWIMSQPFMGDLFSVKSEMLLYEEVLDQPEKIVTLSHDQQSEIQKEYRELKQKLQIPFKEKFKMMFSLLFFHTPPFMLAWLLFSLMTPLLLLLRIEGAVQICWLLPLITFAYGLNNYFYAGASREALDRELFPSEQLIVRHYLERPLSEDIFMQKEELFKGWQKFLIENWAEEVPSSDLAIFNEQAEKGKFAFNIARIDLRRNQPILAIDKWEEKHSLGTLFLYLLWNGLFVMIAYRVSWRPERST